MGFCKILRDFPNFKGLHEILKDWHWNPFRLMNSHQQSLWIVGFIRISLNPLGFYTFTGKHLTWQVQIRKRQYVTINGLRDLLCIAFKSGTKIEKKKIFQEWNCHVLFLWFINIYLSIIRNVLIFSFMKISLIHWCFQQCWELCFWEIGPISWKIFFFYVKKDIVISKTAKQNLNFIYFLILTNRFYVKSIS